eukprot:scaffold119993_cov14-Prasinocladus_malaysianus.AAC.1
MACMEMPQLTWRQSPGPVASLLAGRVSGRGGAESLHSNGEEADGGRTGAHDRDRGGRDDLQEGHPGGGPGEGVPRPLSHSLPCIWAQYVVREP